MEYSTEGLQLFIYDSRNARRQTLTSFQCYIFADIFDHSIHF